jgi:hypothetical protein
MELLSRTKWGLFLGLILSWTAAASAPPPGEQIDYMTGPLSQSEYLNNNARIGAHVAALNGDFPDPSVIQQGNMLWAFGTGALGKNVQMAVKTGMGPWSLLTGRDALPRLPRWVDSIDPRVWAPSITRIVGLYSL